MIPIASGLLSAHRDPRASQVRVTDNGVLVYLQAGRLSSSISPAFSHLGNPREASGLGAPFVVVLKREF